jgi:hypothetical protein
MRDFVAGLIMLVSTTFPIISNPSKNTDIALPTGRSLKAISFLTASSLVASTSRPYTVSEGQTTSPPERKTSTVFTIFARDRSLICDKLISE